MYLDIFEQDSTLYEVRLYDYIQNSRLKQFEETQLEAYCPIPECHVHQ